MVKYYGMDEINPDSKEDMIIFGIFGMNTSHYWFHLFQVWEWIVEEGKKERKKERKKKEDKGQDKNDRCRANILSQRKL